MPKRGHTEEQIVAVLRQVEAGAKVAETCRKVGISQATYYLWKRRIRGWQSASCVNCGSYGKKTGG
jgi:putative transposase